MDFLFYFSVPSSIVLYIVHFESYVYILNTIMNSIPTCYRRILLVLLPLLIVVSIVHFTSPLPPSSLTNSLSNEISLEHLLDQSSNLPSTITTTTTTVPTTTPKKCYPYHVANTRPFFEREPLQSNLPGRISNSSRKSLRRRLRSLRLAVVACARNVEKHVDKFRQHVEPIIDLFHPSSRIIILESDSTDNTLQKLKQWSRAQVYTYGNLSTSLLYRTERIAFCRNKLLEKARQVQADYMLVLDMDIFAANMSSFLTNFDYDTDDWSVMTANLVEPYYDIWALRTLSDTVLNYDIWNRIRGMQFITDYCGDSLIKNIVNIHQKSYPIERGLLEVRSAFGGAGLYKMVATEDCNYSDEGHTCEHVAFHAFMREKNQARIFINPRFTNEEAYKTM
jgi:hypothetical protein